MLEQIEFEEQSIKKFRETWLLSKKNAQKGNEVLVRDRIEEVAEILSKKSKERRGTAGRYNKILADCIVDGDFITVAYIGLMEMFAAATDTESSLTQAIMQTGRKIEDNYKFMLFELEHKGFFSKIKKSLEKRNSKQYQHAKTTFNMKMKEKMEWQSWNSATTAYIGGRIIDAVMDVYADIFEIQTTFSKNKSVLKVSLTDKYALWKSEYDKQASLWYPAHYPLKIEPVKWEGQEKGGYYTKRLQVPKVKTHGRMHREQLANENSPEVDEALNKQQSVAWVFNKQMSSILKELINSPVLMNHIEKLRMQEPLKFPEEIKRDADKILEWKTEARGVWENRVKTKNRIMQLSKLLKTVADLENWERMYFVYNCDLTGRMHCVGSLSTQGSDIEKSLLDFEEGCKVSSRGRSWIKIHTAKQWGVKGDEETLLKWYKDNTKLISEIKEDWRCMKWVEAKKPFQFLRACLEDFKTSHLPIGVDGVCNGLQHYAALFRDKTAARNLGMITAKPADIYSLILLKCKGVLTEDGSEQARKWLDILTRDVVKKPVMLLSYGINKNSMTFLMFTQGNEVEKTTYEEAAWITNILWDIMAKELKSTIAGMEELKNEVDGMMSWYNPVGFKVVQPYMKSTKTRIKLTIQRQISLQLREPSEDANMRKQRNAYPANMIHSYDSAHAVKIVNSFDGPIRCIHDEFATSCNKVDTLMLCISNTFVDMYSNIKRKDGDLNIQEIRGKRYFFH